MEDLPNQILDIFSNLESFRNHFKAAASADPDIRQKLKDEKAVYETTLGPRVEGKIAADFISSITKTVFSTHPKAQQGAWRWDNLEDVAIDALSRVGGAANEAEHAALDSYVWLLRVGLHHLGAESHRADDLIVDSKSYYLSDEYMEVWARTRLAKVKNQETVSTILGPDGRPLESESEKYKSLIADYKEVDDELLKILANHPELLRELNWRRFEEVIAELLARQGYAVTLTSATKDGGKDIYAAKKDMLGSFLYIVECKRYAAHRPVGVGLIRNLYGVVQAERATAGVLATTSFFTKGARRFQEQFQYQISLRDYYEIQKWLRMERGQSSKGI